MMSALASPSSSGEGSFPRYAMKVECWRKVAHLGEKKRAAALAPQMDPIARNARMAVSGGSLLELDGAHVVDHVLRDYLRRTPSTPSIRTWRLCYISNVRRKSRRNDAPILICCVLRRGAACHRGALPRRL